MTALKPTHHPNPAMLSAAARGEFAPAFGRVIEAHAALCDDCRALMNDARDGAGTTRADDAAALPDELKDLPKPVQGMIAGMLGDSRWRFGGHGLKVRALDVPRIAREQLRLLKIKPGGNLPRHTHDGYEFVLVLTGAFKDATGVYRAGDMAFGDAELEHVPVAETGEICFALAATTAPLRFTGAVGVLQRLFNIPRG